MMFLHRYVVPLDHVHVPQENKRYRSMEEQEEKAMDTKGLRKLDYNAPLLSTRRPSGATNLQLSRTNSQGAWRDTSNRVPFSWEQTAGKPKDSEANDNHDMGVVPPPKLPPGRWHPPKANQCHGDDDDGCDGDIEDEDDEDDVFSDAIDLFSLSESIDMPEAFNNVNGLASLNSEIECNSALSPSFIIQRFLTDANALAESSSALAHSEILNKKFPDGYVSPAVRQSYSAPQGCGFDILFPWRMKHKPCGIKSPVRQPSLNAKPQWGSKRKQKH